MRTLIIIPSYLKDENGCWMLEQTIKALLKVEPTQSQLMQLLIVDDGSPWDGKKVFYLQIRVKYNADIVILPQNVGYSAAVNTGLKLAQRFGFDCVVTLNNDCELVTPFLDRLQGLFSLFPRLAVVGAKLYFPTGQIQHAGFDFTSEALPIMYDRNKYDVSDSGQSNTPRFLTGVTGAFQAIRVSALMEIGYYSLDYFMAYEDCEFCCRAWSKNWQVFYDAYIEGVHYEGATRGKGLSETEQESEFQWKKDFQTFDLNKIHLSIQKANEELKSHMNNDLSI